jgi:DNA (cytosine-5)-methyltransferase 1
MKPKLLDLFCGAGGATKGLQLAGFYVVGVDIKPQPHYCGDEFYQADALTFSLEGYDAYWASPPCQKWSVASFSNPVLSNSYPDYISKVRACLVATGKPYIIENVTRAPLRDPLVLCGTMFGLRLKRHRAFESSMPIYFVPATCSCKNGRTKSDGISCFKRGSRLITVAGHNYYADDGRLAMGIDWMTNKDELSEAVPPAYSEYLGKHLMAEVEARKMAALC